MLAGIGVDIIEIERASRMLARYGDRVARRLLTDQELEQFRRRHRSTSFLASRFAAKEAASKALGTGIARGVGFKDIEVFNDMHGRPNLLFHGRAQALMEERKIDRWMLSLSDEKHYAVAMVVLESG